MALKNYKIVHCKPEGKLEYPDKSYTLETLTDEEAKELEERGSYYIEKVIVKPDKKTTGSQGE